MNSEGEIKPLSEVKKLLDEEQEDYIEVPEDQYRKVDAMNRAQRRYWYRQQRKKMEESNEKTREADKVRMEGVARICHQANKALCEAFGDLSQPNWEDAPDWQKESAVKGVKLHISGDFGPEESHKSWMQEKIDTGWKYGKVKDPEKKEHPCMVEFHHLPKEQQAKDFVFRAIVHSLKVKK